MPMPTSMRPHDPCNGLYIGSKRELVATKTMIRSSTGRARKRLAGFGKFSVCFFFVQAYKLSAYTGKYNKLGRNHSATPGTLGVL